MKGKRPGNHHPQSCIQYVAPVWLGFGISWMLFPLQTSSQLFVTHLNVALFIYGRVNSAGGVPTCNPVG